MLYFYTFLILSVAKVCTLANHSDFHLKNEVSVPQYYLQDDSSMTHNLSTPTEVRRRFKSKGQHPKKLAAYVASLVAKRYEPTYDFIAGAAIISDQWVLTIAHAVEGLTAYDYKCDVAMIFSNSEIWNSGHSKHSIVVVHVHPLYDAVSYDYDLAIIKIKDSFNGRHEKPINIPKPNFYYKPGSEAALLGWGSLTPRTETDNRLEKTTVTIQNYIKCDKVYSSMYREGLTYRMVCGNPIRNDPCIYDYSSPLIQNHKLIGLASWGMFQCGVKKESPVFVRISTFNHWIKTVIFKNRSMHLKRKYHKKKRNDRISTRCIP